MPNSKLSNRNWKTNGRRERMVPQNQWLMPLPGEPESIILIANNGRAAFARRYGARCSRRINVQNSRASGMVLGGFGSGTKSPGIIIEDNLFPLHVGLLLVHDCFSDLHDSFFQETVTRSIMWEEHPEYQKQQALTIGLIILALLVLYAGYAFRKRNWELLGQVLMIAAAMIVAIGLLSGTVWLLVKIFTRRKPEPRQDGSEKVLNNK
jgi:uncharacterized membrane protein YbaN (DUF454 family)